MDDDGVGSGSPMKRRAGSARDAARSACLGVGLPLLELCARLAPEVSAQGEPRNQRPQSGDRFAFQAGERTGQLITVADLPDGRPARRGLSNGPHERRGARRVSPQPDPARAPARRRPLGGDTGPLRRRCRGLLGRVHAHAGATSPSGRPRCAVSGARVTSPSSTRRTPAASSAGRPPGDFQGCP